MNFKEICCKSLSLALLIYCFLGITLKATPAIGQVTQKFDVFSTSKGSNNLFANCYLNDSTDMGSTFCAGDVLHLKILEQGRMFTSYLVKMNEKEIALDLPEIRGFEDGELIEVSDIIAPPPSKGAEEIRLIEIEKVQAMDAVRTLMSPEKLVGLHVEIEAEVDRLGAYKREISDTYKYLQKASRTLDVAWNSIDQRTRRISKKISNGVNQQDKRWSRAELLSHLKDLETRSNEIQQVIQYIEESDIENLGESLKESSSTLNRRLNEVMDNIEMYENVNAKFFGESQTPASSHLGKLLEAEMRIELEAKYMDSVPQGELSYIVSRYIKDIRNGEISKLRKTEIAALGDVKKELLGHQNLLENLPDTVKVENFPDTVRTVLFEIEEKKTKVIQAYAESADLYNAAYNKAKREKPIESVLGQWKSNTAIRIEVYEQEYFDPLSVNLKTGVLNGGLRPISNELSLVDSATGEPMGDSPVKEEYNLIDTRLIEVHKQYRFNVVAGVAFSQFMDMEYTVSPYTDSLGNVIDSFNMATVTRNTRQVSQYIGLNTYLIKRDLYPGALGWERFIPGVFVGLALNRRDSYLLGLNFEFLTGVDVFIGCNFARKTVPDLRFATELSKDQYQFGAPFEGLPTKTEDDSKWVLGIGFDLNIFRGVFGKAIQAAAAAP